MANAKKARERPTATENIADSAVTLDLTVAKKIYELYQNVELADTHFHSCQSDSFRQHVRGVYTAGKIKSAFERLKIEIDAIEGG